MDLSITLYSGILLLGSAHGIFLAIALASVRTGNSIALRLLALLTLMFSLDLAVNFLTVSGYLLHAPRLIIIELAGAFLYGPLLYLYVVALTSRAPWRFSFKYWLHYAPFLASLVLLIPVFRLNDHSLIEMIYQGSTLKQQLGSLVLGKQMVEIAPRLLIGLYILLGFRQLYRHNRHIRDQFSLIEHLSLNWLRNLLVAISILWIMYAIALAFGGRGLIENLLNVAIVLVVYTLGYMGMREPLIFSQREQSADKSRTTTNDQNASHALKAKYAGSVLDEQSSRLLLDELQEFMDTERPYLDRKISLTNLAEQMDLPPNYLSQVINQQTGKNFFDFINSHRVEVAKSILSDPAQKKINILRIAMDSGFNSKSAFYTAFKHHTRQTPTEYRQTNLS